MRLRVRVLKVGEETDRDYRFGRCENLWLVSNDSRTLTQLDVIEDITEGLEFTHLTPEQ